MAKRMTIKDALEEFEFYDLFNEILDSHESDTGDQGPDESDLVDLLEEHEEEYDFSSNKKGDYSESFGRNLKEALAVVLEEQGHLLQEDFIDDAMDDEDIDRIYKDKFNGDLVEDSRGHGADADEDDEYDEDDGSIDV